MSNIDDLDQQMASLEKSFEQNTQYDPLYDCTDVDALKNNVPQWTTEKLEDIIQKFSRMRGSFTNSLENNKHSMHPEAEKVRSFLNEMIDKETKVIDVLEAELAGRAI